jgi:hypothetical protein
MRVPIKSLAAVGLVVYTGTGLLVGNWVWAHTSPDSVIPLAVGMILLMVGVAWFVLLLLAAMDAAYADESDETGRADRAEEALAGLRHSYADAVAAAKKHQLRAEYAESAMNASNHADLSRQPQQVEHNDDDQGDALERLRR